MLALRTEFKSSAADPYVASRKLLKDHNYDDRLKVLLTQLNQRIDLLPIRRSYWINSIKGVL